MTWREFVDALRLLTDRNYAMAQHTEIALALTPRIKTPCIVASGSCRETPWTQPAWRVDLEAWDGFNVSGYAPDRETAMECALSQLCCHLDLTLSEPMRPMLG